MLVVFTAAGRTMKPDVPTTVVVFPLDCFGASGTAPGAELLADYVEEVLEDQKTETRTLRNHVYLDRVKLRPFSFATPRAISSWRSMGRQAVKQLLRQGEQILWLGGNHLSVLPVYEELGAENPATTLVVQLDAHLDVHQMHDISPNLTNGNFLLHSAETLPPIINLGHRDLFQLPRDVRTYFAATYSAQQLSTHLSQIESEIRSRARKARRVWIDIDADVFDPAHLPAVEAPLPFGPSPETLLRLIDAAFAGHVVGVSISEFKPGADMADRSLNLLGWLIEWVLLRWYESSEEDD